MSTIYYCPPTSENERLEREKMNQYKCQKNDKRTCNTCRHFIKNEEVCKTCLDRNCPLTTLTYEGSYDKNKSDCEGCEWEPT